MIHFKRILDLNWYVVGVICIISCISFLMLYSAADANLSPWASRQFMRFILGFFIMVVVACIDIRQWFAWSYHLYFFAFTLVLGVEILGIVGMGAQRCWIYILSPFNPQSL
jgi:rod shape determining protein RodA